MDTGKCISISPSRFRNPLVPAAALAYLLSAGLGLVGVILLFDKAFADILVQQLISSGIQSRSSLNVWYVINSTITLLSFLCPAGLSIGIFAALRGRYAQGLTFLSGAFQWLLRILNCTTAAAALYYIFRMVVYIRFALPRNDGAYLIYSLLISEWLMAVQAWLLFRVIRKFLTDAADTAASMGYTLSSGKLDTLSLPAFTSTGLLILVAVNLGLGLDRIFTITVVQDYTRSYYALLTGTHPGQLLAAATQFTGALGNILLAVYLRRYNRICERTRFEANRKKAL